MTAAHFLTTYIVGRLSSQKLNWFQKQKSWNFHHSSYQLHSLHRHSSTFLVISYWTEDGGQIPSIRLALKSQNVKSSWFPSNRSFFISFLCQPIKLFFFLENLRSAIWNTEYLFSAGSGLLSFPDVFYFRKIQPYTCTSSPVCRNLEIPEVCTHHNAILISKACKTHVYENTLYWVIY